MTYAISFQKHFLGIAFYWGNLKRSQNTVALAARMSALAACCWPRSLKLALSLNQSFSEGVIGEVVRLIRWDVFKFEPANLQQASGEIGSDK
jgi:hypothetical protein